MKKLICLLLAASMLLALAACGGKAVEPEIKEWTRQGTFEDENGNYLMVTYSDTEGYEGWGVTFMPDGEMFGWIIQQEENTLHGNLNGWDENADPFLVTVSEEGEDGLQLVVEGGETYHFTPMDLPDATIFVSINTEGWGMIGYEEGETAPELDPEWPFQSAQINLAESETYTLAAAPEAGNFFVKWTKNGEDFSTEPVITVLLDESADFVAVFEEDPDWQNPVINFVGSYQSGRARATVECFGNEDAWITIEWGGSAWDLARWNIVGRLDTATLTIEYSGVTKSIVTYDDSGEVVSDEPEYEDGTGTITFNDDGTFTWHEDQSDSDTDMVFEWITGRQDGERFETVIILEGMEETVQYEHIVNEALGFEMDYDYESFVRKSEAERELFISIWDDLENPEDYLEVTRSAEDADTVAASVRELLSQEYDLLEDSRELDGAGSCIRIEASELKGTGRMADHLQVVYIIPASDGCRVATAHYYIEASEGLARRFAYLVNTLTVID